MSRDPAVRRIVLQVERAPEGTARALRVELCAGRARTFRSGRNRSFVDLLDRAAAFIARAASAPAASRRPS